jgi:hyperosmotically inducible protein
MKRNFLMLVLAGLLVSAAAGPAEAAKKPRPLAEQVRHELAMLPYYGVFDHLAFQVEGSRVVLLGKVTRPTLRSDAEGVVKRIEGVSEIENRIEVLPLSPFDDSIRRRAARAIYGASALNRYALGAQPAIRIIVHDGNVTLEGLVSSEMDRNIAGMQALGVAGAFSVTNNLQIYKGRA